MVPDVSGFQRVLKHSRLNVLPASTLTQCPDSGPGLQHSIFSLQKQR